MTVGIGGGDLFPMVGNGVEDTAVDFMPVG